MISPAARPLAIALLFAFAVLAVLLAPAGSSKPSAHAHPCEEGEPGHKDFHETSCDQSGHDSPHENVIEVDGGRDNVMVFRVYPPPSDGQPNPFLGDRDKIRITLPGFRLSGADFDSDDVSDPPAARIRITSSSMPTPTTVHPTAVGIASEEPDTLVLTIPDLAAFTDEVGEHLIITIEEGTGILAPETPMGFHDPTRREQESGYPVRIAFENTGGEIQEAVDENYVVVKNPVSSTEPGATVRIDVATHANVPIGSNEEIEVDFSGPSEDTNFILPSTISTSRIKIRSTKTFDPEDVLVQGEKVILTVPDDKQVDRGDFIISFSQLARIKNPYVAGNRIIAISSFEPGFLDDQITAVIRRTTTIDPEEGPRGTEFTLKGKGYQKGTVTVFEGDDDNIGPGETLASVKTSGGALSLKLTSAGRYGEGRYPVNTKDSYGVSDRVVFVITSSISFEPTTASVGSLLRMTIVDWEDRNKRIAAVRIAGVEAFVAEAVKVGDCFEHPGEIGADRVGTITLKVLVPAGVPPGEQTVSVYDRKQLKYLRIGGDEPREVAVSEGCLVGTANGNAVSGSDRYKARVADSPNPEVTATIAISSAPLTLSPATAARGQRVTISGSGFSRASADQDDFTSVTVDGHEVQEDLSPFEVGTDGDFAVTVTVPPEVRNGGIEVRIVGWDNSVGQAALTIPEASIDLDPTEGGRGTEVNVTGSGFIVGRAVTINYGDGANLEFGGNIVGVAVADADGRISGTFEVPYSAAVGQSHVVTVSSDPDDESIPFVIEADARHMAVDADVTTMPVEVSHGDLLKVRGENLPAFTLVGHVELGGIGLSTRAETNTDELGSFEAEVLVPQLELGDQVLKVRVGSEVVIHVVRIVPPRLTGHPSDVFKELIREGILARVWHLESSTQNWTFFDPSPEFLEFSTLMSVHSGDILWVHLYAPRVFQEDQLVGAWNYIALK